MQCQGEFVQLQLRRPAATWHINHASPDFGMNRLSSKHVGALAQKAEVSSHHIKNYSFVLFWFITSVMTFDQHRSFHYETQDVSVQRSVCCVSVLFLETTS